MSNKSNSLSMLLSFIAGVGLASSYFLFFNKISNDAYPQSENTRQNVTIKVSSNNKLSSHDVSNDSNLNSALITANQNATRQFVEQEYTQQISTLTDELAVKTKELKRAEQQLKSTQLAQLDDVDFSKQLDEKFDNESENTQWSYEIETALTDFLITSNLSNSAQLSDLECKQTLCKFVIVAEQSNEQGHAQWRELNDKLTAMPWWQQFKLTTSSSNDEKIEFVVSIKE
ncbi:MULTISPECIES: hypothetical protein [unclassified Pseudoalteromonas]|jgi:hypothetical protein|uniref:hypothetical protein n=1 Tax=unclassified Pseudoalteromonas TaxID=194690 RepID=UPI000CBB42B2|nr:MULTISPECIES: hypothetical protein [unclassified Pseudoalteromonas]MBH0019654.1 hypothetical protein [Pseudoalteromonas sp. SWXJ133]MBH0045136.1 hypothetical protein [Pseudoalteromonas sp. NZS11_1]MDN3389662.1 hypothetical protein [Pseudoalteromonas sp. APC 3691]PLT23378.1 hypothetical protein CXF89_19935 [Pseudoalteromonas sp. MelDa3]